MALHATILYLSTVLSPTELNNSFTIDKTQLPGLYLVFVLQHNVVILESYLLELLVFTLSKDFPKLFNRGIPLKPLSLTDRAHLGSLFEMVLEIQSWLSAWFH